MQAQQLMHWHAVRGIPVEVNEPHHWGLRDAHDVISVVMAYLAAYNAKRAGVRDYVAPVYVQSARFDGDLRWISPRRWRCGIWVESLADSSFVPLREVRAGLPFLSSDLMAAKGQLAASTYSAMALSPQIIHVVGYSEAEHAADPDVCDRELPHRPRGWCAQSSTAPPIPPGDRRSSAGGGHASWRRPVSCWISSAAVTAPFPKTRSATLGFSPTVSTAGSSTRRHILKNERFHGILETRMVAGSCLA